MAGIKGMRTGGCGGRKPLPDTLKRSTAMTFRVTESEKIIINEARGNLSLADFILKLINSKNREEQF